MEHEERNATPQEAGYSRTAVVIHWLLAVSIFFLFASSWWMLALPLPSSEFRFREFPFQLHKNIGITLVFLLGLLLFVRLKRRPAPPALESSWMRRLATIDHIALYVLILAVCVSGYLSSSYSGWGTTLWWTIDLPYWGREDEDLNIFYSDIHLWTCWALLAVLSVHIAGAVYHAFRNDGVVRRMFRLSR
ncbi:MAG: cytochrome b/b6 domain-containing protein [Gammaproteobacteria bacterium]|nr:cytochrome b [Gammaproteobacteria bacterium]